MRSVSGKTLLVTGGTGSFGRTAVEHFLSTDVNEIRVFSRDEKKQDDMRQELTDPRLKFILGDVRDYDSVLTAMNRVDCVFHAAALKQVPSCENFPLEAVKTNVVGADNVMRAATAKFVRRCVVLSTDKAVYPVSAMGVSKAMMEKLMLAHARASTFTVFCATRYGNVMNSRGSVIPLFRAQHARGEPLTVTDPDMTRFLMSLKESVALVLHAFKHGQPGDILVQKAPACSIGDLAHAISGRANWKLIGVRLGEKRLETLVSAEEMARVEDHGHYYRIPPAVPGMSAKVVPSYNSDNTEQLDPEQIKEIIDGA